MHPNRRYGRRIVCAAAFCMTAAAQADTVELDNGDRLSGTVESLTATELALQTAYAGRLVLPRERIRAIRTEAPVRVRLADGTEMDGLLQPEGDRAVRIRIGAQTVTPPLPIDRVAAINPPRETGAPQFKARLSLGGNMSRGNTDARALHAAGELVARAASERVTLDGEANAAEQSGVTAASNARLGLKYDHFVAPGRYLYANTRFEHDDQADLDLRSTVGVGGGWQFFDRKDRVLALEGGVSYVNEDYGNAPDQRFPGARVALKYEQALWGDRVRLFHDSDLLLSLDALSDYLLHTRTGVRVPLGARLGVGAHVNVDYDNVPAAGQKKTDTALIFKLDYSI